MLEYERAKTAFSTNEFSGPMNPTIASGASFLPPGTAPGLKSPLTKKAAHFKLEGDAIIETDKDGKSLGKGPVYPDGPGEKKAALGGKLLRLAATDVPNTPRMLMRQRSPGELAGIEHSYNNAVTGFHAPAKAAVEPMLQKLPAGKAQDYLRKGVHTLIENPEGLVAWGTGIPGALEGYVGGKKLLEKAIDRLAPAATGSALPTSTMGASTAGSMAKMGASAPTRGNFMMASDLPPMTVPSLRALLEKKSDFLPDYVTYNPGDFKKAKLSAGQNEGIDENAKGGQPEDFKKTGSGYPPCPHCGDASSRTRSIPSRCGKCDKPVGKEKKADLLDSDWGADTGDPVDQKNFLKGKEKDAAGMGLPAPPAPPPPPPAPPPLKSSNTFKPGKVPGPSIADIAKPKGAGFGTGIAGAFKSTTGIGGTAPVSLSASPGSLK